MKPTKDHLVEAAAELLWERGYAATSPAMIQKRSRAGQGSMYHHFSGKADLAATAIRHSAGQLRRATETALGGGTTALERLGAFLDMERTPLAGCRVGRLVQDPDVTADDQLRAPIAEFFTWLHQRIADVLVQGVRAGELRADTDAAAMASLVVAAVEGGYVLARAEQDETAFRRATEAAKSVLAGIEV
ncbi:TetR/AcrR family transcriptional regulator [Streptomyces murinus]|uniref:AcrR family transcriptional regulator n=1 Tax=Streptomyces murinus TaxID=33900 RepID=A0A7W3NTN6_STRMR|nr:TetR/AcrR family transcriptional regulator [Streptomyces murinus]MBA9056493.1 AcrR family transcriptional regulator [Streptomyces murinus]UWW90948.1 TetR family transcriptional regulator [Streptomyces murinus]WSI88184.1 TetR/AcrR family transcriptional regulator [Streptomyces murinus]